MHAIASKYMPFLSRDSHFLRQAVSRDFVLLARENDLLVGPAKDGLLVLVVGT
jgi:hypothetical protein